MKTKNVVLAGLGLAAVSAAYLLFRTERGKDLRKGMAERVTDWKDSLLKLAMSDGDGIDHAEKKLKNNDARHLKSLPGKA